MVKAVLALLVTNMSFITNHLATQVALQTTTMMLHQSHRRQEEENERRRKQQQEEKEKRGKEEKYIPKHAKKEEREICSI